jgi:ABC-type nitrate/sulfonate/bicarbonate transport system substrate-binding protein
VPIVAPFGLGMNGNAITVSPALYAAIAAAADGSIVDPIVSARALARVVAARKARGEQPLTFGMTFPFSTHNYHLRFWMAAGGVDPDEDVRLVVLPPPYMVESLANGHVDGFCVGAPWNSVAVDLGVGFILHFVSEILLRAAEKVLAVRDRWAQEHPDTLLRLVRAHGRAATFIEDEANRDEVAVLLAAPDRIGVAPDVIRRTLDGRMKIAPDGTARVSDRYLLVGRKGAARPDPVQAAWLYTQMVRWEQAPLSAELLAAAKAVFCPDLYDAAIAGAEPAVSGEPADGIGAFAGPSFDPGAISVHLESWGIRQAR